MTAQHTAQSGHFRRVEEGAEQQAAEHQHTWSRWSVGMHHQCLGCRVWDDEVDALVSPNVEGAGQ